MDNEPPIPRFLQLSALEQIFKNQNTVESQIKELLGPRLDFFFAGMNFIAYAIAEVSRQRCTNPQNLLLKQSTQGLMTTLFNEQLYSARCLWFGDIPCALL